MAKVEFGKSPPLAASHRRLSGWGMGKKKGGDDLPDYSIKCHNTLTADGTVLDNDKPAPPEFIAWHEAKTSLKAPPEAATWKLADVNLYFLSGGLMAPKASA